ncbi:MAG: hypothetical protein ACE5KD_00850 [Candidatus Bathyarchaeia archaeon]
MPITITNKAQFSGIIILFIGVALLAFTFINAFLFLQEPFGIIATGDLARVFGEALAPLIQACIRLMYLGIMGWIGSLLTLRGIPLVTQKHVPIAPVIATQAKQLPQPIKPPKPAVQSQPTSQQLEPEIKPQSSATQKQISQPVPQTEQEEPKAILIPPENRREE